MKKGRIVIDIQPDASGVSLLEDDKLFEHYIEYAKGELLTGNIYKGKVANIAPEMECAFIDIGREKNGFLNLSSDDRYDLKVNGIAAPAPQGLKVGDFVMVQVTREETAQKGAKLSLNLTLPGQLLVYLPHLDFSGVSNKIEDPEIRSKILKQVNSLKNRGEGFIARTITAQADPEEIETEAQELKELYLAVNRRYAAAEDIVTVVHSEGDLLFRTVRDMLRPGVDSIVCNDLLTTEALRKEFGRKGSRLRDTVKLYEGDYDILDAYSIAGEVDKLLHKTVELQGGGQLVIEHTEALTAIDVNTARFAGVRDYEQSILVTNAEAAVEIARQLRLRNIGGVIVVDFIDMQSAENKTEVVEVLRRELSFDRIKTRVTDMTGLGLVEIARKRVGNPLSHYLSESCPACKTPSCEQSAAWVARKLKVALKRLFAEQKPPNALVAASPYLIEYIFTSRAFSIDCKTAWKDKRIYLIPNPVLSKSVFAVTGSHDVNLTLPDDAKLLY